MIQPQRIGRYLETDSQGWILPDVSPSSIDPVFIPVISAAVSLLFSEGGAAAVYLRGSVPRGLAIPGRSDIDFLYLSERRNPDWEEYQENALTRRFPQVRGVELGQFTAAEMHRVHERQRRPYLQMLLKTQSLYLAGTDLMREVAPFSCDVDLFSHAFFLQKEFERLPERRAQAKTPEDRLSLNRWFCRRVVRTGLEITLDRKPRYTRDLMLCYEQFAEFYPGRAAEMYAVLVNALNGEEDPGRYRNLVGELTAEARHRF